MSIKEIEDFYFKYNIETVKEDTSFFPPLQYEVPSAYDESELSSSNSSCN